MSTKPVPAAAAKLPILFRGMHRAAVTLALVLAAGAASGCSSGGSPMAPVAAGGGGGGMGGGGGSGGMSFSFGPFGAQQSAQLTFPNAGTFGYHCIAHQAMGMVGSVAVDAAGSDSAVVQIGLSGLSFSPSSAHIKPGGYVRWINVSSLTNHTVTNN